MINDNPLIPHLRNFEELLEYIKTKPLSRSVECGNSNTFYIHYGDIHSKYNGFITASTDIPNINDIEHDYL